MTEIEPRKEPRGIAGSIHRLFEPAGAGGTGDDGADGSAAPASGQVPEPVGRAVEPAAEADPEVLAEAVERYLDGSGDRAEAARTVRAQGLALREAGRPDPLADAVERLAGPEGRGHPEVRELARELVSPAVASRLVARLGTARAEDRREELVAVCASLGHEMALAVADALADTPDRSARRAYLAVLVALGPEALPVLEDMTSDGRWFVVRNAVSVLGDVGGDRAVELVTTGLGHPEAKVRRETLLALAKLGGDDAGLLVQGVIGDPDPEVRQAAAMAAGELRVERALKPLLAVLDQESDPEVLIAVLRALGQLGDPGAVNSIEKHAVGSFFSRPPAEVRIAAYRALHNIGTPHARELIRQAAEDKDLQVRAAVRPLVAEA